MIPINLLFKTPDNTVELIWGGFVNVLFPLGTVLNVQMNPPEPEGGWTPELQALARPINRTFQAVQYMQGIIQGSDICARPIECAVIELDESGKPKQSLVQAVKSMIQ